MSLIARYNGQSVFGNACNTVASLTKNFLVFATPLQIEKNTLGPLHQWCKHFQKRFAPPRDFRRGSLLAIELALRRSARGFDTQADGLDTIQLFVAHTLTDS